MVGERKNFSSRKVELNKPEAGDHNIEVRHRFDKVVWDDLWHSRRYEGQNLMPRVWGLSPIN